MPIAEQRVELPIDHFRLLGVSPSAQSETVLRAFQLRLDRSPDEGFTHEVLLQRAELLRLSADLLTDQSLRQEYEAALLGGATGLELSSNREVAGLILLWEAEVSYESFDLARKALQPPQTPALGSGREADLTLVAALSCQAAAKQEQEQRHYQSAALILKEGIQLLQRMGKLPDKQQAMEEELASLLPYRILDLVSRELGDHSFHQEGLDLLDGLVRQRGGLEGNNSAQSIGGLSQPDFELFFQQIRKFLTVQEQLDLFIKWQKRGSAESGFLAVVALVAAGFSQRKPERVNQARKYLKSLDLHGVDKYPLLGCMNLLLADVSQSEVQFRNSSDEGLKNWLDSYPGEALAALCDYCRDWLRQDVLPGYRDVDVEPIDLEAWFADRDVQAYVEGLERKGAFGITKSSFSFLSPFSSEKSEKDLPLEEVDSSNTLPMPGGVPDYASEDTDGSEDKSSDLFSGQLISSPLRLKISNFKKSFIRSTLEVGSSFLGTSALVLIVGSGAILGLLELRKNSSEQNIIGKEKATEQLADQTLITDQSLEKNEIEALVVEKPSKEQVKALLDEWLRGKAILLSGKKENNLVTVARKQLVKRVELERAKDLSRNETQIINASISSLKFVSQTSKRIEVQAKIAYSDQRLTSSGEVVSETSVPSLKVTYILGREKELWQLVDYISGN
tara:strand:- start:1405 stop:3435 length:2031 start_codon:yes stop_codon:yes gene_type:complete